MGDYLSRLLEKNLVGQASIRPRFRQPFERSSVQEPSEDGAEKGNPLPLSPKDYGEENASPQQDGVPTVQVVARVEQPASATWPRHIAPEKFERLRKVVPNELEIPNSTFPERSMESPSSDSSLQHMPTAGPVIRVTIGRIEVRAVQSSTPPVAERIQSLKPLLTLDEYLKSRKSG